MNYRLPILLLLLAPAPFNLLAEESPKQGPERKVVQRTRPVYPELARRINATGTVKLLVTIDPNGSVKAVEVLGGNPVLIPAAEEAVMQWKFVPGPSETQEVIHVHFDK